MKKEHIIVLMLMAVVAMSGGVYQFYLKPRLEIYSQHRERVKMLEEKVKDLENTFMGFKPEVIVAAWTHEVQPWTDAVFARASFFDISESFDIEPIPDEMMLKFYYQDESNRMLQKIHEKIRTHRPYCYYPNPTRFGAPRPEDYRTMTKQQVRTGLGIIKLGSSIVEMLLDANAAEITRVEIWPKRFEYDELLNLRTAGVAFKMTMENLVKFIEDDLRTVDRYFNIDAISMQNRQLRSRYDPLLDVQMLSTQAGLVMRTASATGPPPVVEVEAGEAGGPMTPGQRFAMLARGEDGDLPMQTLRGLGRRSRMGSEPLPELTKFQRFLRWMDKYYWPF